MVGSVPFATKDSCTVGSGRVVGVAGGEGTALGVGLAVGEMVAAATASDRAGLGVEDAATATPPALSELIATIVNDPMARQVKARPTPTRGRPPNHSAMAAPIPSVANVPSMHAGESR